MARTIYKFGTATSVNTGETIICSTWNVGGADPFPASSGALTVVSSSAEDNPSGTGTGSILIDGLRGSPGATVFTETEVTLNGTTPVAAWSDAFRVFRIQALTGSSNVGNIDVLIGGATAARIPAGDGQTQTTVFSLSEDQEGWVRKVEASMLQSSGTTPRAEIRTYTRRFGAPWRLFLPAFSVTPDAGVASWSALPPASAGDAPGVYVPPGSDIKMEIESLVGSTVSVFGNYEILVEGDPPGL